MQNLPKSLNITSCFPTQTLIIIVSNLPAMWLIITSFLPTLSHIILFCVQFTNIMTYHHFLFAKPIVPNHLLCEIKQHHRAPLFAVPVAQCVYLKIPTWPWLSPAKQTHGGRWENKLYGIIYGGQEEAPNSGGSFAWNVRQPTGEGVNNKCGGTWDGRRREIRWRLSYESRRGRCCGEVDLG